MRVQLRRNGMLKGERVLEASVITGIAVAISANGADDQKRNKPQ
jgi:hypothetical protein